MKVLENGSHCKPFSAPEPPPPSPPSPPLFFPTPLEDKWVQGNDRVPGPQITSGRSARPLFPPAPPPPPPCTQPRPSPSPAPPLVMCTRAAASSLLCGQSDLTALNKSSSSSLLSADVLVIEAEFGLRRRMHWEFQQGNRQSTYRGSKTITV
ncbi:unnamed protein product [Pleuronectes platessa]|uniref:Uncharacterized protein n=1 Tax=Pleuronectes platessa TaxID=8262 RepID=A0A9N7Z4I5_PLEPL|nr:unnamed protein product [Pleuronectes platessa]